jgi:hypothetical protein
MTTLGEITVQLTANVERFRRAIEDARMHTVHLADIWHDQWLYSLPWYRQWWHWVRGCHR